MDISSSAKGLRRVRGAALILAGFILLQTACATMTSPRDAAATLANALVQTAFPETAVADGTPAPQAAARDTASILAGLGGQPCPGSDFTCVTLSAPLDHFNSDNSASLDVVFGVLPASGERKGMFVTAVGGPGSSGLVDAGLYASALDPSIREHFDIVFFDPRGVGLSSELECPYASGAYFKTGQRGGTPEREAALLTDALDFAGECVTEMDLSPAWLGYYGTRQAVEDLELFRQAFGDEKIWLYGESYGTQYAQIYALAHPERLAGLILDGVVDLTLNGPQFFVDQTQSFSDVLEMTLNTCTADEYCAADFGGNALAFYEELETELKAGDLEFSFPLPSGGTAQRTLRLEDFELVARQELYSEQSRMIFLRALANAYRGDLSMLARLLYMDVGWDPETLHEYSDPTSSDPVYFTVECNEFASYYEGTPSEQAQAYLREGERVEASIDHLTTLFYRKLPCPYWPQENAAGNELPSAQLSGDFPTFVLGATADPATPVQMGLDVYSRLENGYLITTQGGAHVIFGRGDACPDEIITAFLVEDALPAQRETSCEGVITWEYAPLTPADAAEFDDLLDTMKAAEYEFYLLPEYYYWDFETPATAGCPFGGTISFAMDGDNESYVLGDCAFSNGFSMTGTGGFDVETSRVTLDVEVGGLKEGRLTYVRDSELEAAWLMGEYGGEEIDLGSQY